VSPPEQENGKMVRRIEGTSGIEVYVGQKGHVCLKQDDFEMMR
jgi:hypothetical protein